MEGDTTAPPQLALPALPDTVNHEAQTAADAQAATRRDRDVQHKQYQPADEDISDLTSRVASTDRDAAAAAVMRLWELTVLTRRNRVANQLALAALGGAGLMVDYAAALLGKQPSSEDQDAANMALLVLENLSMNVQLHHDLARNAALLGFLISTIGKQWLAYVRINAAKILVNITFSDPQLQELVARAGGTAVGLALLRESESELVRQGAWLLSHVTAGRGCAARGQLAEQLDVLESLRALLTDSKDPPTRARVCEVVCNLARGDAGPHANLARAGVVPALLPLIDPRSDGRQDPAVVAPALLALAALAAGGDKALLHSFTQEWKLSSHLAGILDYSNLVTRDFDLSRVLMAAHALIFTLGTFTARAGATSPAERWPENIKELLQESGFVSFQQCLSSLGLEQPKYVAASLGKDLGGPHCFVANTSHQVNVELLPVLKHDNARMVANTCARLYQIAVCLHDHPEGRQVLANGFLVVAVRDLLSSEHSAVLQAALSLVSALAAIPELVPLLVDKGVMDQVHELSEKDAGPADTGAEGLPALTQAMQEAAIDKPSAAGRRSGDLLIKMLAERVLVTMFLAQGGHLRDESKVQLE
uniref:Homolog of minus gamete specific protein n=2 Tax=unclassified Eudorina TaxID=2640314 RepID=A0A2Z5X8F7_9CHLO|nr:homolog of minus gamete specific protein [Eudorina sp. NIES-3984]BBC28487.1 homolog of minus gamete specific protein [Eudorina sp. 2006-703-Eu-15]